MTNSQLDLSQLAIDRSSPDAERSGRPRVRRKWLSRYVVPGGILLGFAVLLFAAAGKSLWPRPSVQVIPVVVKRASVLQSGTPLFQAAGWIEPRPTAINVPALAPGVIEELLVVEGQSVEKGDPIARLISIDAEIAVKQEQAALATAEGELNRAIAERTAARTRLQQPIHLRVPLAAAKSLLAQAETELANLPFQIEAATSNLEFAKRNYEGKSSAGNAVPGVVLLRAKAEKDAADAKLRELQNRKPRLEQELVALQEKVAAINLQLKLLVEETRQLDEATAKVQSATAMRDASKLNVQKAKLALERNTIRAPIKGRILRLTAAPGMRVMVMGENAGQHSSAVVEMYDPARLQVRADVRLEDVPRVQHGQPVEIETASSDVTIHGRVLQTNSVANIQKNTLEVKVELLEGSANLRPEMLVTATFLAPQLSGAAADQVQERERLFVPSKLVQPSESGSSIWVVDADEQAQLKPIVVGSATSGDLVEVASGLSVTDKLITSDLSMLSDGVLVLVADDASEMGR